MAGYDGALQSLRDAGAGDQDEAVRIIMERLERARKARDHVRPPTIRRKRALERADREAKTVLREQVIAEDCDRRVAELLQRNMEALGKAEAGRVNLAAARQ